MAKENPAKNNMDGVITDKRFSRLHSDPRFTRLPRNNLKVQIDSRFQRMFSDKKFSESLAFDKRGRPKKKKEKNKLLEYYHHQDQEEDDEEENDENANKETEQNNEDKPISRIDAESNQNDEMVVLPRVNSSDKTHKKKKKNKGTHETHRAENGHVHGASVREGDNFDNVRGISDSKKKKKKKECKLNDKFGELDETVYTEGGRDGDKGTQETKKNKMTVNLADLGDDMHAEEGADVKQGVLSTKKKKKNKNLSGLGDSGCTEEAQENNREVELKEKKKKKTKVNNDLDDLEERMYKGKNDAEVHGLEQVKEDHEQVRTLPEEEVLMVSGRCKDNSNSTKKMKGGGRFRDGGEHLSATYKSNVAKGSQKETESEDREKQKAKRNSIFGGGKKGNITVEGFLKTHHKNENDQELSESESSSGEDVDVLESEESETSSSSDDDEYDSQIELESPEKEEVPTVDRETRRLAVVNMDWNHIKAVDLLVMMNSLLPKGGYILSVYVYPSEFGLKQMKEEAIRGPALFGSDDESDEDEETEIDNEKLRQYEKARLRYYYAVIECDSSATADYLYKACDGVEFERTSNVMDLRFIPDDMEFSHPPRDVATEVPTTYEAPDFHTRALQHSKVNISWDDDEPLRVKTLNRKYDPKQLNEMDFKAYLASDDDVSDGEEDEEREDVLDDEKKIGLREKYRSLLLDSGDPSEGGEDKEDKDMEITFNTGLEELSKRILEKNKKNKPEETVWEAYLQKRSEKRKARKKMAMRSSEDESDSSVGEDTRNEDQGNQSDDFFLDDSSDNVEKMGVSITGSKVEKAGKKQSKLKALSIETKRDDDASKAELELLLADDHGLDSVVRGYNLKPKKSKGRKHKQFPTEDKLPTVDTDDPRFSALFTSHHFAIDPTDPQFKRSATYSRNIVQKQQKKFADKTVDGLKPILQEESKVVDSSTKKRKTELSSLIKSVKRKVGTLQS